MGTRERQEREREVVRRAIIDAAKDLFVAEGFGKVSMRRIAERIEYSPAAIYSYFPGKDDIFYALAEEGFRLLCTLVEPSHSSGYGVSREAPADDLAPLELIRRALNALYRFSQAHPEYYALMFLDRSVPSLKGLQDRSPLSAAIKARLVNAVQECIDTGIFPVDSEPHAVFRVLTTAAHGAATANVCGRLHAEHHGDALAHDLIELTIAGLRAGVRLTFVAAPFDDQPRTAGPIAGGTEPVES